MKQKKIILLIFLILSAFLIYFTFFNKSDIDSKNVSNDIQVSKNQNNKKSNNQEKTSISNQTAEIKSACEEKVELHAGYYLEEIYINQNEYIEAGTNILKYTNGIYLTAPYNCCISSLNIPDINEQCSNDNYVEIKSTNILAISLNISENSIEKLNLGDEAKIQVQAIEKTYTGYIAHIGSVAANGKFEVIIEFENDGNIKLGMTAIAELS